MARVVKFFKILKNNPKKSIFFSGFGVFATNFGKNKYQEEQLMAKYCREAAVYGEQLHSVGATIRHITVLLNPAAAGGKCKAKFDKYCVPLLHLAGIKVAIVRTEHQGQARELMAVMEKTDGVVVAGGDGTLSEVLTGLLRRTDQAADRLPLAVLPLGTASVAGRAVWGLQGEVVPRDLMEATMAVVREVLRPMDVMEVTPHAGEEDAAPPKPIYLASLLEWGAYRDAWERRDKYWYWATLKRYATYVFSSYKDISWDCSSKLEYTLPCAGCSTCYVAAPAPAPDPVPAAAMRWYQHLLPSMRSAAIGRDAAAAAAAAASAEDYSGVSNPGCGVLHSATVEGVCDVRVSTRNCVATQHLGPHQLVLHAGTADTTWRDFITEGWRRCRSGEAANDVETLVGTLTITPTGAVKNKLNEDREFSLDGESYEVKPVTIRALPKAVTIYAPAPLLSC